MKRPLWLNFQTSKERISRLDQETGYINLAKSRKRAKKALKEIEEGQKDSRADKKMLVGIDSYRAYKTGQNLLKLSKRR